MKDLYGKTEKHQHKLTNLLKYCIFAIIMLAPFFAILSKMIYVSANKNAKDSYYGETINEYQVINVNEQNFKLNQNYNMSFANYTLTTPRITIYNIEILEILSYSNNDEKNTLEQYKNEISIMSLQNNQITFSTNEATILNINPYYRSANFTFTITNGVYITALSDLLTYKEYNDYSYLDNAFYYAIEQSKDEELLRWTKDTPIYNVINTMNIGFGLSSNHILTYLLTYWSIMIAIYIIFDILIFALTKLTHWLQ